jgi:hypothetical protein
MLTLTNPQSGVEFKVERLPRCPGEAAGGWRLAEIGPWGAACIHVHQFSGQRPFCDCPSWSEARACQHVKLLVADGLIEEPAPADPDDPLRNGLVDIDILEPEGQGGRP